MPLVWSNPFENNMIWENTCRWSHWRCWEQCGSLDCHKSLTFCILWFTNLNFLRYFTVDILLILWNTHPLIFNLKQHETFNKVLLLLDNHEFATSARLPNTTTQIHWWIQYSMAIAKHKKSETGTTKKSRRWDPDSDTSIKDRGQRHCIIWLHSINRVAISGDEILFHRF